MKGTITLFVAGIYIWVGSSALSSAFAVTITKTFTADRDGTMYEEDGGLANGSGQYLFAGKTLYTEDLRRTVLRFSIHRYIPSLATIDSVTLKLNVSRTSSGPQTINVHRLLEDWGEGITDAPGQEGAGAPAQYGDVTWTHRYYPNTLWTTEGGEFSPVVSASQIVDSLGTYSWTGPGLLADVQTWLSDVNTFHGWIVKIADEGPAQTTKRFDSGEHPDPASRPVLEIVYTLPPGVSTLSRLGLVALAVGLMGLAVFIIHRRRLAV